MEEHKKYIPYVKNLIKKKKLVLKGNIQHKIEKVHRVSIDKVKEHLENPDKLILVQKEESRNYHDETYDLIFELSKRRKLFVVITHKKLKNKIFIVTAFETTKKLERLVKKIRRIR